jgi:hypothetical protein
VFSAQIFQENTFLKTKPNFSFTGKCFSLTNFPNGKLGVSKKTDKPIKPRKPEKNYRKNRTEKKTELTD